jgi:hypothetical protein
VCWGLALKGWWWIGGGGQCRGYFVDLDVFNFNGFSGLDNARTELWKRLAVCIDWQKVGLPGCLPNALKPLICQQWSPVSEKWGMLCQECCELGFRPSDCEDCHKFRAYRLFDACCSQGGWAAPHWLAIVDRRLLHDWLQCNRLCWHLTRCCDWGWHCQLHSCCTADTRGPPWPAGTAAAVIHQYAARDTYRQKPASNS